MYIIRGNFVLLEVLIAFTLVTISVFYITKSPINFLRSEIDGLKKRERRSIAEEAFNEVKLKLFTNDIPWASMSFDKSSLQTERKVPYNLWITREKTEEDGTVYRLLKVEIIFPGQKPVKYSVFVKR